MSQIQDIKYPQSSNGASPGDQQVEHGDMVHLLRVSDCDEGASENGCSHDGFRLNHKLEVLNNGPLLECRTLCSSNYAQHNQIGHIIEQVYLLCGIYL